MGLPRVIDEDDRTLTYEKDDGSTFKVLKSAAEAAGIWSPSEPAANDEVFRPEAPGAGDMLSPAPAGSDAGIYRPGDPSAPMFPEADLNAPPGPNLQSLGAGIGTAIPAAVPRADEVAGIPAEAPPSMLPAESGMPAEAPAPTLPGAGTLPGAPGLPPEPSMQQQEFASSAAGGGQGGATEPTEPGGYRSESVRYKTSRPGKAEPIPDGPASTVSVPFTTQQAVSDYGQAAAEQMAGATTLAEKEKEAARERGRLKAEFDAEATKAEDAYNKLAEERAAERTGKLEVIEAKIDAALNKKVDTGRFWSSRSTGQKILAGISIALGAFAQGKRSGIDIIMEAIDEDVRLQSEQIQRELAGGKMQLSLLQQFDLGVENELAYKKAAMAMKLKQVERDLDVLAEKTTSETADAKLRMLKGEIEQKRAQFAYEAADNEQKFAEQKRATAELEKDRRYNAYTGRINAMRMQEEFEYRKAQDRVKAATEKANVVGQLINPDNRQASGNIVIGNSRYAGDKKQMVEDNARIAALVEQRRRAVELRHLVKYYGRMIKSDNPILASTAKRRIDSLVTQAAYSAARAVDEGRLSDADVENQVKAYGGGARGLLQRSDPAAVLDDIIRRSEDTTQGFLQQRLVDRDGNPDTDAARQFVHNLRRADETEYARERKKEDAEAEFFDAAAPDSRKTGAGKATHKAYTKAVDKFGKEAADQMFAGNMFLKEKGIAAEKGRVKISEMAARAMQGDETAQLGLERLAERDDEVGQLASKVIGSKRYKEQMEAYEAGAGTLPLSRAPSWAQTYE